MDFPFIIARDLPSRNGQYMIRSQRDIDVFNISKLRPLISTAVSISEGGDYYESPSASTQYPVTNESTFKEFMEFCKRSHSENIEAVRQAESFSEDDIEAFNKINPNLGYRNIFKAGYANYLENHFLDPAYDDSESNYSGCIDETDSFGVIFKNNSDILDGINNFRLDDEKGFYQEIEGATLGTWIMERFVLNSENKKFKATGDETHYLAYLYNGSGGFYNDSITKFCTPHNKYQMLAEIFSEYLESHPDEKLSSIFRTPNASERGTSELSLPDTKHYREMHQKLELLFFKMNIWSDDVRSPDDIDQEAIRQESYSKKDIENGYANLYDSIPDIREPLEIQQFFDSITHEQVNSLVIPMPESRILFEKIVYPQ